MRHRDERGQTTLLIVGFFLVVALFVALAVDASAAYLQRQGLANLADGAALAAADGVKAEQVYTGGLEGHAPLDAAVAARYAERYLDQVEARSRYEHLTMDVDVTDQAVIVRVRAPLKLPLAPPDWDAHPVVEGDSAALVVVGP